MCIATLHGRIRQGSRAVFNVIFHNNKKVSKILDNVAYAITISVGVAVCSAVTIIICIRKTIKKQQLDQKTFHRSRAIVNTSKKNDAIEYQVSPHDVHHRKLFRRKPSIEVVGLHPNHPNRVRLSAVTPSHLLSVMESARTLSIALSSTGFTNNQPKSHSDLQAELAQRKAKDAWRQMTQLVHKPKGKSIIDVMLSISKANRPATRKNFAPKSQKQRPAASKMLASKDAKP